MATDTGSNYWLIGGGETPAPPSTLPPAIAELFGPVTRSGYAQAPVDPLSYYNPAPPPVETTPYTGGPTKWYEVYRPTPETPAPTPMPVTPAPVTPDLSSVDTFNPLPDQPSSGGGGGGFSQPSTPSAPSTPASQGPQTPYSADEVFPGFEGLRLGDEVPGMPGTRVGGELIDDAGNRWDWRTGTWIYSDVSRPPSYEREDGAIVTPGGQTNVAPPGPAPTITLPPESVTTTPVPQTQVITQPPVFEERVTVTTPPKAPEFEFQEPAPARNPIVLPGTSVLSRPVITTPLPDLPVNSVLTRNRETIPSRYFRDINYDPEEILAAAMRSMGGRMARRSILNELS